MDALVTSRNYLLREIDGRPASSTLIWSGIAQDAQIRFVPYARSWIRG